MKLTFITCLASLVLLSCSTDDARQRNPNLLDINFSITLNTNQVQYSNLQFASNAIYEPTSGNRGIFVINTGTGIRAWDASDPNHPPNNCSTMTLDGLEVTCPCEGTTYILFNGLAKNQDKEYPLLEYRASQNGNFISISN